MYKEVLLNFSYSELVPFINEQSLHFSKGALGKDPGFIELVEFLSLQGGIHTLSDKEFRHLFIEKMSVNQVGTLLKELQIENVVVNTKTYENLKKYSDLHFNQFCFYLGLIDRNELNNQAGKLFADTHRIHAAYQSYPYQRDICNKIIRLIDNSEKSRALIHLPTGSGKTRTAMNIICEHLRVHNKGVVVWLADRGELCQQAQDEFQEAWHHLGNREISSYSFYENSDLSLSGIESGLIVMGLQKLNSFENSGRTAIYNKLKGNVSLVVFDEAHKAIAPTYANSVEQLISVNSDTAFILGLTATPGRKFQEDTTDEISEDEKLANFFDNIKVTMKVSGYSSPITYLIENQYLAKPNFHSLSYDSSNSDIDFSSFSKREIEISSQLAKLDERNQAIIQKSLDENSKGSMIIIFACDIQHCVDLAFTLGCMGVKAASLDSKNDDRESRKFKIDNFKSGKIRVLVNYGILTTGFDAPKTNVAIIARPTSSLVLYMQMIGRAMRGFNSGGNKECEIYTVIDDIPEFIDVGRAFEHWDNQWSDL